MPKKILIAIFLLLVIGFVVFQSSQKSSQSPQPIASTAPTNKPIPENWQTFRDPKYNYSINYPENYEISDNGDNSKTLVKKTNELGAGPANFIYVSVVDPVNKNSDGGTVYNYNLKNFESLENLNIGESKSLSDPNLNQDEWFTYQRLPNEEILGRPVKVFKNEKPWEFPSGTTEYRYHLMEGDNLYIIGSYIGAESSPGYFISEEEFKEILSTFSLN